MKDTLIIGSEGYIGSALYGKLKDRSIGIDVYGSDVSINYGQLTKKEISKYKNIVLLAANAGVKPCEGAIKYSLQNNVINFTKLLSKINKKQKFIYASTGSIYGNTKEATVSENELNFIPSTYYDLTKYIDDMYASLSNIEYYGLRFGTVNGKTSFSNKVRDDVIINSMIKNAIVNKKITAVNTNVNRGILGLNDLCNAIEAIIDNSKNNRGFYNIASFNTTVGEISDYISNRLLATIEIKRDNNILYDFKLNTNKFCDTYQFKFEESLETICNDLIKDFNSIDFIRRDKCLKI
jgi:nucleoside-diphosphate-sugar epimerase